MLCLKMATRGDGFQFPCGQCQNCRINKRREWQARLLLEAASHAFSAFLTLTFSDRGILPVLRKTDLKFFFRALRKNYPDVRHFSVGEYGSRTGRAHYHSHVFSSVPIPDCVFHTCWPYGNVHVGDTEPASLDYVLGYLLKPKTDFRWPVETRFPEFRAFSRGMAKDALGHLLIDGTELSREFSVFSKKWPVGRYLRDRAKKMGFTVSERKETRLEAFEAQAMRGLLSRPGISQENYEKIYDEFWQQKKLKSQELQKKAIRAAYKNMHGHDQHKVIKNETL